MSKTKPKRRQKRIWKKEIKVSWSRKAHRRDKRDKIYEICYN